MCLFWFVASAATGLLPGDWAEHREGAESHGFHADARHCGTGASVLDSPAIVPDWGVWAAIPVSEAVTLMAIVATYLCTATHRSR